MPNPPQESPDHKLWSEAVSKKRRWQHRFRAAFDHLSLNATDLTIKEASDRAADFATQSEDVDALDVRELEALGPEPPYSDEDPTAQAPGEPPPPPQSPLRANPNPAMDFGAWGRHDQRAY